MAMSHRTSIEQCLNTNYGVIRMFRIGSFGHGTSISGFSDVDYLVSIRSMPSSSSSDYVLQRIRSVLDARFPNTAVRVNCPAVAVPFGNTAWERHEIVPGDLRKTEQGFYVYDIPNCDDGWLRASPEAHIAYVKSVDEELNGKVRPLIRFIKAWKYFRNVPISSFYIEMRVAKYASAEQSIIYKYDVPRVLRAMLNGGLAAMQDPMGLAGHIYACKSDTLKADALSKLETAVIRAERALAQAEKANLYEAFEDWKLLFGARFPNYYL